MPDSEHPSGDDSRDLPRRSRDESTPVERRSRTSTADRRDRPARRGDASRTPPRRQARTDDDVDVAAALARVPDATSTSARETTPSNGNGSNGNGSNGNGSKDHATGRVVVPPARRPRPAVVEPDIESVDEPDIEPDVESGTTAEDETTVETTDMVVEESVEATEVPMVDDELLDTQVLATVDTDEIVETPTEELDAQVDTEVLPVVIPDVVEPDVVEPEAFVPGPTEPEIADPDVGEPRIYDVEADEPGAYVALVPAVPEPAEPPALVEPTPEPAPLVVRRRRRPRVRRVTRVIRHVDTWTVFKVVLLFNIVLYATAVISGVLLWNVAHGTGTVDNVERFMESFGWETFQFDGQAIFDNGWRIGLFLVLGLTGLAVLAATTFNLITDIVGGIRVTVLEEEVVVAAPPMPRRRDS